MPELPNLSLSATSRGGGRDGGEPGKLEDRLDKGNPPKVFRTRFTRFHIMFRAVNIREPWQMIAALSIISVFSLLATVLFFMMQRFETRAVESRRKRWAAAPMFALRLLFVYALILLVEIMNIWVIIVVAVGHMAGWFLYFVYIKDCLTRGERRRGRGGDDGSDGGDGKDVDESSVSSHSSHGRQFWDFA